MSVGFGWGWAVISWNNLLSVTDAVEDFVFFRPVSTAELDLHVSATGCNDLKLVTAVCSIFTALPLDRLDAAISVDLNAAKVQKAVKASMLKEQQFWVAVHKCLELTQKLALLMPVSHLPHTEDAKSAAERKALQQQVADAQKALLQVASTRSRFAGTLLSSHNHELEQALSQAVGRIVAMRRERLINPLQDADTAKAAPLAPLEADELTREDAASILNQVLCIAHHLPRPL